MSLRVVLASIAYWIMCAAAWPLDMPRFAVVCFAAVAIYTVAITID